MTSAPLLTTALSYLRAGLSPVPVWLDSKQPALGSWEQYTQRQTRSDEIRRWFARDNRRVGIVCGLPSGGLEIIDIDNKGNPGADAIIGKLASLVRRQAPGLWERLYVERTAGGGYHIGYRCETVEGAQKLALRPPTEAEHDADPRLRMVGLIETRGQGSQCIVAPSCGYEPLQGSIEAISNLSPVERELLLQIARSFDMMPAPEPRETPARQQTTSGRSGSLIERYNQGTSLVSLLQSYGGRIAKDYGSKISMHCPCSGHSHGDTNASLIIKKADDPRYGAYVCFGYSPSCEFYAEQGKVNDAFAVYCIMERLSPVAAIGQLYPEARERQARALQIQASIRAFAAQDSRLTDRASRTLDALLTVADRRDWCRPSVARLCEMTGLDRRTIYRALDDLESLGYMRSEKATGYTTTMRHLLEQAPVTPVAEEVTPVAEVAPEIAPAAEALPEAPAEAPSSDLSPVYACRASINAVGLDSQNTQSLDQILLQVNTGDSNENSPVPPPPARGMAPDIPGAVIEAMAVFAEYGAYTVREIVAYVQAEYAARNWPAPAIRQFYQDAKRRQEWEAQWQRLETLKSSELRKLRGACGYHIDKYQHEGNEQWRYWRARLAQVDAILAQRAAQGEVSRKKPKAPKSEQVSLLEVQP